LWQGVFTEAGVQSVSKRMLINEGMRNFIQLIITPV